MHRSWHDPAITCMIIIYIICIHITVYIHFYILFRTLIFNGIFSTCDLGRVKTWRRALLKLNVCFLLPILTHDSYIYKHKLTICPRYTQICSTCYDFRGNHLLGMKVRKYTEIVLKNVLGKSEKGRGVQSEDDSL